MDCADVKTHLLTRTDPAQTMAALGEHLAECPACRTLAADDGLLARGLGGIPASLPPADGSYEAVAALIAADSGLRARFRSRPTWERRLFVILAVLAVLGLNMVKPRADMSLYPAVRMLGVMLSLCFVGVFILWAAMRPLHLPPPARRSTLLLLGAGLLLPWAVALLPVAHLEHAASVQGEGGMFAKKTVACLIYGSVFALPVIVAAWLFDRSSGAYRFRTAALLAAVAGGVAGNLALQAHCPITGRAHLVLGHATVGLGLLAAFLITRALGRPSLSARL